VTICLRLTSGAKKVAVSNKGTPRAFRNAHRFSTLKNLSPAELLFDDVSLQVNRGDRIGV
jgi:hypothetical protein